MKTIHFIFVISAFLLAACEEQKAEPKAKTQDALSIVKIQEEDEVETGELMWQKNDSVFVEPPLVGDRFEPCSFCKNSALELAHRAPFRVFIPRFDDFVVDSNSSLRKGRLYHETFRQRASLEALYRSYLEQMIAENGSADSFVGKISLRIIIDKQGNVSKVLLISSSMKNPSFDRKVVNIIKQKKFSKSDGKSAVSFDISFVKTIYPRGFVEIVKPGL